MLKKIVCRAPVAAVFALVCCGSAFSQTHSSFLEHREWEGSFFAGPTFGESFKFNTPVLDGNQQVGSRVVGMKIDEGFLLGTRISQNLGNNMGANLEYVFANQNLSFTNISPTIQSISMHQYIHHISYNVLFQGPRDHRFRPYGALGAGVVGFTLPSDAKRDALLQGLHLRDSWKFLLNGGGGFKYLVKDQFVVGADVMDRASQVPAFRLPSQAQIINGRYIPGIADHGTFHNWQIGFSVIYQWDEDD